MVDIEMIEQKPIALADIKENLDNAKKKTKELNFRAEKVHTYLIEFTTLSKKEADEMYEKLKALNMSKLRDRHIVKILDILPADMDGLKTLFSGEATSLKSEELKQILGVINSR